MTEPLPNPDIMVRKKEHRIYFVPETPRAEEWLMKHELCARPEAKYDARVDSYYGDVGATLGTRGAIRGSVVKKEHSEQVWSDATRAGLVVRRQPR